MRNDLCGFNDAYIVVTGKVTATNPGNDNNVYNKKLALKKSAPFFNCILKINNQLIEDAQDLDVVMPMYNLLYYSKNFRETAAIIIQTCQVQDIITTIGTKYFIQLRAQRDLTIKLNYLVLYLMVKMN